MNGEVWRWTISTVTHPVTFLYTRVGFKVLLRLDSQFALSSL